MIKPRTLQKGDLIAIAAPASAFDRKSFMAGVKKLREFGFEVTFRKDIFSKELYLAGSDKRRAEELNQFFADPKIKGIFFARGGYGTQRIVPLLDIEPLKTGPKVILGYSDITALHSYLYAHGIGGSFYGPTIVKHFSHGSSMTAKYAIDVICGENPPLPPFPPHNLSQRLIRLWRRRTGAKGGVKPRWGHAPLRGKGGFVLKHGSAEGVLAGGCLSIISSSIGTIYDLPTNGTILFLEDVGEAVFRYDRMLNHLKAAGKLRRVAGIVFGSLGLAKGENKAWLDKMLKDVLADFPGPIVANFPSGHLPFDKLFVTLPLGVKARLTTEPPKLDILESALI